MSSHKRSRITIILMKKYKISYKDSDNEAYGGN